MSTHNTTRSYHHGDLRATLLAAGKELLTTEGLESLSLRAVAAKAEVSHNAPYRHFPDRRALLSAIASQGFTQLVAELDTPSHVASALSPHQALVQAGHRYLDFALCNPQMYRLMFDSDILDGSPTPEIGQSSMAAYKAFEAQVAAVIGQQAHAGATTAILWSQLHGVAMMLLRQRIRPWMREGISDAQLVSATAAALPALAASTATTFPVLLQSNSSAS